VPRGQLWTPTTLFNFGGRDNDYNEHHYHQPSDDYDPKWDLSGSVQEAKFVLKLAGAVSDAAAMPKLKKDKGLPAAVALSK